MHDFMIISDSAGDMGAELVQKLNVEVVPLHVLMDGRTFDDYPDKRDISDRDFYNALREGKTASTAAVNVEQFVQAAEPALQAGKDVLILCFSSALSSTYSASALAAEELGAKYPARRIFAVDTLCASLGHGLMVWHAAQQRQEGKDIEDVRAWVEENKLRVHHIVAVEDLHHLHRGGRLSAASAVFGSMLSIKPIIHVNDEGSLVSIDKVRGRMASLKYLVDYMEKHAIRPAEQKVFICHSDCEKDAETVAQMVRERLGVTDFYVNNIGPVIGAHTGPGTIALFYMAEKR